MNNRALQRLNEFYADKTKDFGEGKPASILLPWTRSRRRLHVLDVGAGTGRNSQAFLDRGHAVTAIEVAEKAVKRLQARAKAFPGLRIIQKPFEETRFGPEFDRIIVWNVLQLFRPTKRAGELQKIKDATRPGGVVMIRTFQDHPTANPRRKYFSPNELRSHFKGWNVQRHEIGIEPRWPILVKRKPKYSLGLPIVLIARKPKR